MTHKVSHLQSEEWCRTCAARTDGFCGLLQPRALADVSVHTYRTLYQQGDEIAGQGEYTNRVGIVASGLVKTVTITESGEEYLLQVLKRGALVGNPTRACNSVSWEAATDTAICWMPRTAWEAFLAKHPDHYAAVLSTMCRQFDEFRQGAAAMRGRNTMERLASWLLEQVPEATGPKAPRIRITLTRRDLASLLDMTVETLCRALHQLSERKAIRLLASDHIEVTDIVKLRVLAKCQIDRVAATLAAPAVPQQTSRVTSWTSDRAPERDRSGRRTGS